MPHFDLVHRGMGPDAHTASLFPGEPLIDDREGIAAAVYAEKFNMWRVTLLPGALLAAKHTVFLVAGEDKAEAVRAVFHEEYDPKKYPAQIASHHGRGVTWFLDESSRREADGLGAPRTWLARAESARSVDLLRGGLLRESRRPADSSASASGLVGGFPGEACLRCGRSGRTPPSCGRSGGAASGAR